MVLTIIIGLHSYRHSQNSLIHTLYRDGALYFIALFRTSHLLRMLLELIEVLVLTVGNVIVLLAGPVCIIFEYPSETAMLTRTQA